MATVDLTVPVTPATAERWRDPTERARLGALLSAVSAHGAADAEIAEALQLFAALPAERCRALAEAVAELRRASADAGLPGDEDGAELAAWKRGPATGQDAPTRARERLAELMADYERNVENPIR